LILFAIILLLGVAAVYLLTRGGGGGGQQQAGEVTPVAPDVVFVAIAAQDIARGARIPEDGIVMSRMPANMVVETMISGNNEEAIRSEIVGRVARQDIGRGVPITEAMISEGSGDLLAGGSDASLAIPPGYTAIAIPMDRLSGVAYALRDGDVVDVLISLLMVDVDPDFQTLLPDSSTPLTAPGGTSEFPAPSITGSVGAAEGGEGSQLLYGKVVEEEETGTLFHLIPNGQQRPRAVSQRLVDSAQVLHVGTFALEESAAAQVASQQQAQGAGAPGAEGQTVVVEVKPPDIITLIVTPQDALALNWAIKVGADLTLTLRAPNDTEPTETTSVTLQYLIEGYDITVPSRLPYSLEPALDKLIDPKLPNDQQTVAPTQ